MVVMHRCDNPKCINPGHLEIGTQAQNQADMAARGRAMCRERMTAEMRAARSLACKALNASGTLTYAHLKDRERHPKAKAVIEPSGKVWPSAAMAAEHHGLTKSAITYRARTGAFGWRIA
jgi:hypothetical protein